jgi:hypothetical protein
MKMSNVARLSIALADVATDFAERVKRVTKYHEQVCALETAGFSVQANEWKIRYQGEFEISRKQLTDLRKAVGRLSVESKYVPGNFNETSEIVVTVKPMSKDFDMLKFSYRSPFRGGGKCHVETQTSSYQTMVCKV